MEFRDVVRRRRMVRSFADRPVDPAAVDRMLAHATRAPSAGHTQPWEFLRLDRPDDVALFWDATTDPDREPSRWLVGMRGAPVLLLPFTSQQAYLDRYAEPDKGWTDRDVERWSAPYWWVDIGMAALLLLQTAVDEGLGACLFGIPRPRLDAVRSAFGVPSGYEPVGAVAVGHPAPGGSRGSAARRPRRTEVVHRGRWGQRTDA